MIAGAKAEKNPIIKNMVLDSTYFCQALYSI